MFEHARSPRLLTMRFASRSWLAQDIVISYTIVSAVVVLFDSMAYVFFKVAPRYYKHQSSVYLHKLIPIHPIAARFVEEKIILGVVLGVERSLKNVFQVLLSKLTIAQFTFMRNPLVRPFPAWGGQIGVRDPGVTLACEQYFPGSESVSVFVSSIGFWMLVPMALHLLFNTFMYGLAPPQIDKDYGRRFGEGSNDLPIGAVDDYRLHPEGAAVTGGSEENPWKRITSSRIPHAFRAGNDCDENIQ